MDMTDSFKSMFSSSDNKTTTSPVTTEEDLRLPVGAITHISNLEKEHGLQPGTLLAITQQESGGEKDRANARSKVGAQGWFQFMPATAKQYKVNPADFFSASSGAAKYLSDLNKQFDGDQDKVLAAYNWGQGNVSRKGLEKMPSETSNYLTKVKENISKFGGMFEQKPRSARPEPDPGFPMNMFTPDFKKLLGIEEA